MATSTPKMECFMVSIEIPFKTSIIIIRGQSIEDGEKYFSSKIDREVHPEKKAEFETARSVLKWASACNGWMIQINKVGDILKFIIGFSNIDDLTEFSKDFKVNVSGA